MCSGLLKLEVGANVVEDVDVVDVSVSKASPSLYIMLSSVYMTLHSIPLTIFEVAAIVLARVTSRRSRRISSFIIQTAKLNLFDLQERC